MNRREGFSVGTSLAVTGAVMAIVYFLTSPLSCYVRYYNGVFFGPGCLSSLSYYVPFVATLAILISGLAVVIYATGIPKTTNQTEVNTGKISRVGLALLICLIVIASGFTIFVLDGPASRIGGSLHCVSNGGYGNANFTVINSTNLDPVVNFPVQVKNPLPPPPCSSPPYSTRTDSHGTVLLKNRAGIFDFDVTYHDRTYNATVELVGPDNLVCVLLYIPNGTVSEYSYVTGYNKTCV
jgi:hypothetical protein